MTFTSTNLADVPWIPVRRRDGTATDVGLREVFRDADQFTEISASSPLEHEAITRFLTTVTALVVRAVGPGWDPRAGTRFPLEAVEAALSMVAAHLDLADRVDPFMQDAATGEASEFNAAQVTSLSLDRPNLTVQAWHFRGQLAERPDGQVDWARLATLLVTFWYFSGTNNLDIAGRKQTGSLCGKAGNGLHLFWRGPTLAHTLLANTPRVWVEGSDLPAWADRDGFASGAEYEGAAAGSTPLWWGSYSPNTVTVWADETTGLPALCITGGSPRQPTGMPAPLTRATKDAQARALFVQRHPDGTDLDGVKLDQKAECAQIVKGLGAVDESNKLAITALADWLRLADPAGTMAVAKPVRLGPVSPDLATLRNLAAWYEAGAADLVARRVTEVVLAPDRRDGMWALEFCQTKTKNPTSLVYTAAAWVDHTPQESAELTLDPAQAKAVLSVAQRVEEIADLLCRQLSRGWTLADLTHLKGDLRDYFYVLARAVCTQAIKDAATGHKLAREVIDTLCSAALEAFDETVLPFAGPALGAAIIQARGRVQRDLASTLSFWGDGPTDNSDRTRDRVLSDYDGVAGAPRKAT
jgi:hypothetical protein